MPRTFRQLAARSFLALHRVLPALGRTFSLFGRILWYPFHPVARLLFRGVFVPIYKLTLLLRRPLRRFGLSSKNPLVFLIANRYVVHAAVLLLVIGVSATSVFASEAQITDVGNNTLLFSLLSSGENEANATVTDTSPPVYLPAGTNYLDAAVRAAQGIDDDGESFLPGSASTIAEGSALLAPSLVGNAPSVAPRDHVVTYTLQDGDTIGTVAATYDISVRTILWANGLGVRDVLKIGQSLKIPPLDGVLHTVKRGDTIQKIANTYGADQERILATNRLSPGQSLRIGEELMVPDGEPPTPISAPIPRVPRPLAPIAAIKNIFSAPPAATVTRTTKFLWPTSGHVITQYYGVWEHVQGWRIHTGIDIDGDYTSAIYAADDGIVIISGWRTGYGNSIDIDHGDGTITRYAHSSRLLVKKGERVTRGQVIAMVGTTGYSTGTHLHFEVRIGGKAVNPIGYIR